ncbi:helix-turn-helix domain-containing protein [Streptomyces sp. B1866]|uniref:helix-turn-helix domain-containing protein n=1 Tax=Streptomyces sp. B1866 TaxID=3075431 RepID=UPI0028920562|nr:helix-turn-helix domain-containing protein [Streptomyces sp. B1866]MDT3398029.1 helix-turn-helix domain-containing protein [Streptomyces sp. B1866]
MPSDATPDPGVEALVFGQRMKMLRNRRGMSRTVLGGLLDKSPSWVKQVERGILHTPSLSMVLRIAEALRVRDLAELVGCQPIPTELFIGPGHQRLPKVREAINRFPVSSDRQAPTTAYLRSRLTRAWSVRHSSPNHREVIGEFLPELIRDAQLAVRQADTAADRRAAHAVLAEVYGLSQFFLSYQPDSALLWRVCERGLVAAQESEHPHAIGVAAWLAAQAHRDSGHFDAADAITHETIRFLTPLLPEADTEVFAIAGALQFEAGYTAARRGDTAVAWSYWDKARALADRLPPTYFHPITSFSDAIMGAHAVTVAVELHAGGESVRQAEAAASVSIPSRPRRARHRIEEARGYQLDGQPDAALATLEKAFNSAPETIRYNGYARRIVLEESESKSPARRRRAAELAVKIGVLTG